MENEKYKILLENRFSDYDYGIDFNIEVRRYSDGSLKMVQIFSNSDDEIILDEVQD